MNRLSRALHGLRHRHVILMLFWMVGAVMVGPLATPLAAQGHSAPGGIGGTGLVPGGIGGTGRAPGGIGGTGIVAIGPVQRFGSVFVLGKEYHFTAQTTFVVDGQPAEKQQVQLGDLVMVSGHQNDGRWVASRVQVDHALVGRVEQVDVRHHRIRVLGQSVWLKPATRLHLAASGLQQLKVGEWVRVSAAGYADGGWIATSLSQARGDEVRQRIVAHGLIQAVGQHRRSVRLNGAWLPLAQALPARFVAGQQVRLTGRYVHGKALISSVQPAGVTGVPVGRTIELYGVVRQTDNGQLYCNDFRLQGDADAVVPGALGLVQGRVSAPGVITVDSVTPDIDPWRYGLGDAPDAGQSSVHSPDTVEHEGASAASDAANGRPDAEGAQPQRPETPETPETPAVSVPEPPSVDSIPETPSVPDVSTSLPEIPEPPEPSD